MLDILLVDDDPSMLQLLGKALRVRGHQVTLVPDSAAALTEASHHQFAVVLYDAWHAGLDALGVVRRIHATSPETQSVVIKKPFALADLLDTLKGLDPKTKRRPPFAEAGVQTVG